MLGAFRRRRRLDTTDSIIASLPERMETRLNRPAGELNFTGKIVSKET